MRRIRHVLRSVSGASYRGLLVAAMVVLGSGSLLADPAQPLRIVTFGTSLTARGGWQDGLQDMLRTCTGTPVSIGIVALSGASSEWGVTALDEVVRSRPDVVLIEFAINDAALQNLVTIGRSRGNLLKMIDRLQELRPAPRIAVMAMNPAWGMRGLVRPFLKSYLDAHRKLAESRNVAFLDHGPAWRGLTTEAFHEAIPDGIHPRAEVTSRLINPSIASWIVGKTCERE
jgi:lysophospholipase L1-like esterase